MLSLQPAGVNRTKLDAPEADRFAADGDTAFSEEIFDISVAEIEAEVQPDCVGNYVRRESVSFISIHPPILSIGASLFVSTS